MTKREPSAGAVRLAVQHRLDSYADGAEAERVLAFTYDAFARQAAERMRERCIAARPPRDVTENMTPEEAWSASSDAYETAIRALPVEEER